MTIEPIFASYLLIYPTFMWGSDQTVTTLEKALTVFAEVVCILTRDDRFAICIFLSRSFFSTQLTSCHHSHITYLPPT